MTEQDAVKNFINQVEWLHEAEYGDFKRKVSLYLHRLHDSLKGHLSPEQEQIVQSVKHQLLYKTSGDIEETRRRVIDEIEKLLSSAGQQKSIK